MIEDLRELYQQVILDHSRHPRNEGILHDCISVHADNPSCGDELVLFLKIDPSGNISDIKFQGQGCAISQASASMMTTKVKNLNISDALALGDTFRSLVTGEGNPERMDKLGELQLLAGVQKFPQRVKCAMLGWRALQQAAASHASNLPSSESTSGTAATEI